MAFLAFVWVLRAPILFFRSLICSFRYSRPAQGRYIPVVQREHLGFVSTTGGDERYVWVFFFQADGKPATTSQSGGLKTILGVISSLRDIFWTVFELNGFCWIYVTNDLLEKIACL